MELSTEQLTFLRLLWGSTLK